MDLGVELVDPALGSLARIGHLSLEGVYQRCRSREGVDTEEEDVDAVGD